MDPLNAAKLHDSAMKIIENLRGEIGFTAAQKAQAWIEVARAAVLDLQSAKSGGGRDLFAQMLSGSANPAARHLVQKEAALSRVDLSGQPLDDYSAAFVQSFAPGSLLDQILRYATEVANDVSKAVIATATTADEVSEGGLKLVKKPGLSTGGLEPVKAASIVAFTDVIVRGPKGLQVIEQELRKSVLRAINRAVLDSLLDSNTTEIPGTVSLPDAISEAGDSAGYVVAASPSTVAAYALADFNRAGLGTAGGDLVPGISIVPVDSLARGELVVIPADRLAVRAWPLRVEASNQADLNMADSPTSPSELVSMFQTNSVAMICERMFLIGGDTSGVVHVLGDSES